MYIDTLPLGLLILPPILWLIFYIPFRVKQKVPYRIQMIKCLYGLWISYSGVSIIFTLLTESLFEFALIAGFLLVYLIFVTADFIWIMRVSDKSPGN